MSHACWKITVFFFWVCPCRLIHLCFCRFSNRIDGVLRAGRVDLVARLMLFTIATSSIVKILSSPANPTSHMLLPTIVGSIARKTYSPASLSLYVLLPPAPSSFEKLSSLSTTRATVCSENVCHLGLADIRRKRGAEDGHRKQTQPCISCWQSQRWPSTLLHRPFCFPGAQNHANMQIKLSNETWTDLNLTSVDY